MTNTSQRLKKGNIKFTYVTKISYWIPDCRFWQLSPAWWKAVFYMVRKPVLCLTRALLTVLMCSASKEGSRISNSCALRGMYLLYSCISECIPQRLHLPPSKVFLTLVVRGLGVGEEMTTQACHNKGSKSCFVFWTIPMVTVKPSHSRKQLTPHVATVHRCALSLFRFLNKKGVSIKSQRVTVSYLMPVYDDNLFLYYFLSRVSSSFLIQHLVAYAILAF